MGFLYTYKAKLETALDDLTTAELTPTRVELFNAVCDALDHVCDMIDEMPSVDVEKTAHHGGVDMAKRVDSMDNADGSHGAHWSKEQTTTVGKSSGIDFNSGAISPECWYVAMNMMYSDYSPTATKYGLDRPDFYAALAKDFLLDKDGGGAKAKLEGYYRSIVES